jgi:N-acetylmuramic acid 6-phosphate (MurNAc-6-P) etherase
MNLGERVRKDAADGLRMLLAVDEDVGRRLETLVSEKETVEPLVAALEGAIHSGQRIYVYGCGATGRLAKQMESAFWRPFWARIRAEKRIWPKLEAALSPAVEDQLTGEMTGADRALISSLEGFEDLQLIGRLQLTDRGVRRGDIVICVTEGGETSSVIGTILAALDLWRENGVYDPAETRRSLFFVYNNPDERLRPLERSRRVLEEPGITKINLTTGPQAITGSTRMQATTSETFVIGMALEEAVERTLRRFLSKKEMALAGFERDLTIEERLRTFASVLDEVKRSIPAAAELTALEAETYGQGRFSTYLAGRALMTVFIDSTERSPTFRLFPLDTAAETKRKCWIQVWTPAAGLEEAWRSFLGRPFRGLAPALYQKPFAEEIDDPYLRTAALESLKKAGDDQQFQYDFSFAAANIEKRGPKKDDLGVMILISPEDDAARVPESPFRRFVDLLLLSGARPALVAVGARPAERITDLSAAASGPAVPLRIGDEDDPLGVRQQVGLKMLLNAHSTAVMARLGKVIGNTMTNVSPSNLKLIGRATHLIQLHINDVLSRPSWVKDQGSRPPVSYGEANAVLFDAIAFLKDKKDAAGQTAEVALSIIRILESLRQNRGLTNDEALEIVRKVGLSRYLSDGVRPERLSHSSNLPENEGFDISE